MSVQDCPRTGRGRLQRIRDARQGPDDAGTPALGTGLARTLRAPHGWPTGDTRVATTDTHPGKT